MTRMHLSVTGLEDFLRAGAPAIVPVPGEPPCAVLVDPASRRIGVRSPASGPEPDTHLYRNIEVVRSSDAAAEWYELWIAAPGNVREAYSALCDVVDRIDEGARFDRAVTAVLTAYRDMLAPRTRMSVEQQVGLLGELLLLRHLTATEGPAAALATWRGTLSEEHDFGLVDVDVEVKTTTSEARRHLIGSVSQLQPSPGRPLWLLSIQLTRAPAGGGRTLSELVAELSDAMGAEVGAFEHRLDAAGWSEQDAHLYSDRYVLRTTPAAFAVDDAFPAVTQARVDSIVPNPAYVVDVMYRLDLTHYPPGDPPGGLARFVTGGES